MPREPKSALALIHASPGARRLDPPPEFTEGSIECELFRHLVASVPFEHFTAEDMPLLTAFARAAALERRSGEELLAAAVMGDRPSPWLAVHGEATRAMAALATKLRIGPKARRPNDSRRVAKPGAAPSYYETMRRERETHRP
jgi:hypothetical protein